MPGPVIAMDNRSMCIHGAPGAPTRTAPKVFILGKPVVLKAPCTIGGCPGIPPNVPPCMIANWAAATVKVKSQGAELLILPNQATTNPTGKLTVLPAQLKVMAT